MSPLLTRRRSRRRSRAGRLVLLACVLVVAAVLIGGVARIGSQSGPFNASVNRSFATQGAVLVDQSNATGASLRRLMGAMQDQNRLTLQAGLDDVTAQAGDQATLAARPGDQRQRRGAVRHRVRGSGPLRRRGAVGRGRPARSAPPERGRRAAGVVDRGGNAHVAVVHPGHRSTGRRRSPARPGGSQLPVACVAPWPPWRGTPGFPRPDGSPARARGRSVRWRHRSIWWRPRRRWRPPRNSA